MTDTDTTTTEVEIARGDLVLVTLSEAYATSWEAPAAYRGERTRLERTFYATRHYDASDDTASDYVTLVVAVSDPRHVGMWPLHQSRYGLELEGDHFGWDVQKRHLTLTPVEGPEGPVEASADLPETFTREDVDRLVSEAREAERREQEQRHQRWVDNLVSEAHAYADENQLCGNFDRFMLDHDLPPRDSFEIEYRVEVERTMRYVVYVTGTSEEDAAEQAEERVRNGYESPEDDETTVDEIEQA